MDEGHAVCRLGELVVIRHRGECPGGSDGLASPRLTVEPAAVASFSRPRRTPTARGDSPAEQTGRPGRLSRGLPLIVEPPGLARITTGGVVRPRPVGNRFDPGDGRWPACRGSACKSRFSVEQPAGELPHRHRPAALEGRLQHGGLPRQPERQGRLQAQPPGRRSRRSTPSLDPRPVRPPDRSGSRAERSLIVLKPTGRRRPRRGPSDSRRDSIEAATLLRMDRRGCPR